MKTKVQRDMNKLRGMLDKDLHRVRVISILGSRNVSLEQNLEEVLWNKWLCIA